MTTKSGIESTKTGEPSQVDLEAMSEENAETAEGTDVSDVPKETGEDGAPAQAIALEDEESIPVEVENDDSTDSAEMAALLAERDDWKAKYQESYDRLIRTTADLENLRRRSRRDVADARVDSKSKILREILPVLDNLQRAIAHSNTADKESKGITEGVQLVLRQFEQVLNRCDVKAVDSLEKAFDPNIHEAVGQLESADHPPGTVLEELQRGYTIGERLLRPAMVVVSKAAPVAVEPAPAEAPPEEVSADSEADPDATVPSAPSPAVASQGNEPVAPSAEELQAEVERLRAELSAAEGRASEGTAPQNTASEKGDN